MRGLIVLTLAALMLGSSIANAGDKTHRALRTRDGKPDPQGFWEPRNVTPRAGFKDEMPIGEGGGQGAGDIFVMRFDGSEVRQLTDDAWEEATPAFAPTRKEGSTP